MSRGDRREDFCLDDVARQDFLKTSVRAGIVQEAGLGTNQKMKSKRYSGLAPLPLQKVLLPPRLFTRIDTMGWPFYKTVKSTKTASYSDRLFSPKQAPFRARLALRLNHFHSTSSRLRAFA
jgi:hypothetical protein